MARPTLVIGMGGTGQWVLTHLKKDLLEIGGGTMPEEVKLLSFDTTRYPSAKTGHDSRDSSGERRLKKAGAVKLDNRSEFVHVGSDLWDLANEIQDGKYPHLDWFAASRLMKKLGESAFHAQDGAGAVRHIGRLCLVKDVQAKSKSKIMSKIRHAINEIPASTTIEEEQYEKYLEVIIVASLAGGTGAGMLVDVPLLCRHVARDKFPGRITVRGFIITPRAFAKGGVTGDNDMLARSFAAWRELDRMNITSQEYGSNSIRYSDVDRNLDLESQSHLYDTTYMIDPQRVNSPLTEGPETGLFPAVANAISAILDQKAGSKFTEQIHANYPKTRKAIPLMPTHSAVGSYTLKLPVYYKQRKKTYTLAKRLLDIFLAPKISNEGFVIGLSDTANEVSAENLGINAPINFLNADSLEYGEVTVPNTGMMKLVAKIRADKFQGDGDKLDRIARGGLARRNSEFLQGFIDVQEDEHGDAIVQGVTSEATFQVWDKVQPSRDLGEKPGEGFLRIERGVERMRLEHYGIQKTGRSKPGSFQKELEKAKLAQLNRFGSLLRIWTEKNLNGVQSNQMVAKGGKLGYVRSFYANLEDVLTYFLGFVDQVKERRNQDFHIQERTRKSAAQALQQYKNDMNKSCPFTFWDDFVHPDAHQAQRNYLRAANQEFNVLKDQILLDFYQQTVQEMKLIVENTLQDIEDWIVHLAKGDLTVLENADDSEGPQGIKSLYQSVIEELDNIEVNHALDKQLGRVSEVIGEEEFDTVVSDDQVDEILGEFSWRVERVDDESRNSAKEKIYRVQGLKLKLSVPEFEDREFINTGRDSILVNSSIIESLTSRLFQQDEEILVSDKIREEFSSGRSLAEHLDKRAEPFINWKDGEGGPLHKPPTSVYIRVKGWEDADSIEYFSDYRSHAENLDAGPEYEMVDSEDSHKMSVVKFDNIIKSESFEIWHRCRNQYIGLLQRKQESDITPGDLHVFQEEINACEYEELIQETTEQNYKLLHTNVVALLKNKQRVEMFFRSLALGIVFMREERGTQYWVYETADGDQIHMSEKTEGFGEEDKKFFFHLMDQFVSKGRDKRPDYSNSKWIDFGKLHERILEKHDQLGQKEIREIYTNELTRPGGMINQMKEFVNQERSKEPDPRIRGTIAEDVESLINLAEAVYKRAARKGK